MAAILKFLPYILWFMTALLGSIIAVLRIVEIKYFAIEPKDSIALKWKELLIILFITAYSTQELSSHLLDNF
jgi:hypothetical protein